MYKLHLPDLTQYFFPSWSDNSRLVLGPYPSPSLADPLLGASVNRQVQQYMPTMLQKYTINLTFKVASTPVPNTDKISNLPSYSRDLKETAITNLHML